MRLTSGDLLEFGPFKQLVSRYTRSPLGRAELEKARPLPHRVELEEILADTAEALAHEQALQKPQPAARGSAVPIRFAGLPDCEEPIAKLGIEGTVLDGKQLLAIIGLLEKAMEIRGGLAFSRDAFPRLAGRATRIGDFHALLRGFSGKLLPGGALADGASVALKRLRREVERQRRRVQESLERFLRRHREDGILQEEFVTIRNDRFVVPVVAGRQHHLEGVVHAASGTGHTLFVEPLETIELNNGLVRLAEEVLREEHRLLREMTEALRQEAAEIGAVLQTIGELEFLFAKARFAVEFGGVIPRFSAPGDRRLLLREARHPLLEDVLRRQKKEAVPISLELDTRANTLLISGPNTGGKTVSLKTVGLLALMAQAGFPVTAAEAEFPLFDKVLADIGDNQSIQESLSTFSAHIERIREMIDQVRPDSLVLIDELGRATDPEEGGALGIAVLDEFRQAGAFTICSTHLLALKVYGANTEGVSNASMGFNDRTLKPTYRLRLGAPGKSAGLEVAGRLGLPPDLIQRAREQMSSSERDLAAILSQLHEKLESAGHLERELRERNAELAARQKDLARDWKRRERNRLTELEMRANKAMAAFEARAEETIEHLADDAGKRKAADKARRKVARARREFQQEMAVVLKGSEQQPEPRGKLTEGATVRLRGVRQPGRVKRFLGDDLVEIEAGFLKLRVSVDDVVEVLPPSARKQGLPRNVTLQAGPKAYLTTREINLIGKHAEEAREEVDKFLDSAALASVDRVRIIHGHGMGVLRRTVAELLDGHPHVEKFYPASPAEGGTGATIAELNV